MSTHDDGDAGAWSALWRTGVLHSCWTSFDGNYGGAIAEFWNARFSGLGDGARIVDVGTGNGALPLLAAETAAGRGLRFEIHGVDSAEIFPPRPRAGSAAHGGIRFHPRTSATDLPFEDASVDLVTSQYAIEYMPRGEVVAEILRVIGTTGRAAFLMHSDDSVITKVAVARAAACSYLFGETDILDAARDMVRILEAARAPLQRRALAGDAGAERTRTRLNDAARALVDRAAALGDRDLLPRALEQIRRALAAAASGPGALGLLDAAERSLRAESRRISQLQSAILDQAALGDIRRRFEQAGLAARLSPVDQAKDVRMGWSLVVGDGG